MSAAESESLRTLAIVPAPAPAGPATPPAHVPANEPLVESASDVNETWMTYGDGGRPPVLVVAVWVVALLGLAAYIVAYYVPDLRLWIGR